MGRRPSWELAEIRELAAANRLALTLSVCDEFMSRTEAFQWVKDLIAGLRTENFAHSVQLAVHRADVYGVVKDRCGWYVKITRSEDSGGRVVLVISCHRLEHPLKTRKGVIEP